MSMHIRTSDTAGFTYQGDVLCQGDTARIAMRKVKELAGAVDITDDVHDLIAQWARLEFPHLGIWAPGEFWTYDTAVYCSDTELPKPFTDEQVDTGETCHVCTAVLGY